MLTHNKNPLQPKRKDLPWLLVLMVIIWISGTAFFHSPWEPYEPYVVAVVKSIINHDAWLVPYISKDTPYLELQPFYFWVYAFIIKIFNFSDIANAIRLINTLIILSFIYVMGKIGSQLPAYKNGRSVVLVLISSVGFINNAYQLSPNILVLFGFSLYFYALIKSVKMPGISAWILSLGLILISLHFTAQFIVIAILLLIILPIVHNYWRKANYYLTILIGLFLFLIIFITYSWQLNKVNPEFFLEWKMKYTDFIYFQWRIFTEGLQFYLQMLSWYLMPSWILLVWTFYKRRNKVISDPFLCASFIFLLLMFLSAILSGRRDDSVIFPIIIPFVLLASLEIDSIRINIVALLNWFSIFAFGLLGILIAILYVTLSFGHPQKLLSEMQFLAPDYAFSFDAWHIILALIITGIWLFMISRKHIRGREMVTNWASGTTFCLIMFMALCLPWFDSLLSFKDMVQNSQRYLKTNSQQCIATNQKNRLQSAIWYYYADVQLSYAEDFAASKCNQAIISLENQNEFAYQESWRVIWSAKRPIDTKRYVLLERIGK